MKQDPGANFTDKIIPANIMEDTQSFADSSQHGYTEVEEELSAK